MKNHSLFVALRSFRGNPRGCVYFEPVWGIPYNLYAPYVSIYMITIGLSVKQIGLIVSISWFFQIFFALISGAVTDKIGRRRTTLIFDILSWSIPAFISAVAQNFQYFLFAGIVNSLWRITHTSWSCLLVEDADQDQLVDIFTWIYIANNIVGFIAPIAGILIGMFSFVPTLRGLYFFAVAMFTLKAILTYLNTDETAQGKIRMRETKNQSIMRIFGEYKSVLYVLLREKQTLYTAAIMLVMSIVLLISENFWSIFVVDKLRIPTQSLAVFPFVKSAIMLIFYFSVMPVISKMKFRISMVVGFLAYVISQIILISSPKGAYGCLIVSVFVEACSVAAISPLIDKMIVLTVNVKERARILSIISVGIILFTSPFGWISGMLYSLNKAYPFVLEIFVLIIGAALVFVADRFAKKKTDTVNI